MITRCPPPAPSARLQDLPPAWARFCLRIERFVLDTAAAVQNSHVLLACSAGSDSLSLLLVMHHLAPRLKTRLTAAHLDHRLRQESRGEAESLAGLCETLGIRLFTGRSSIADYSRRTGLGIEEAGRTVRYRFLFGLRTKIGADMVMTAHHADDLAEDVLMRLFRGAGWPGLAGMPAWDPQRRLARPLLHTPRHILKSFLRSQGLAWHEDAGNRDPAFLRNRIRGAVLPTLKREFPGLLRAVTQVHALGALDQDFFQGQLDPMAAKAWEQGRLLDRALLDGLHPSLRLRLFKILLDRLGPGQARHDALLRLEKVWRDGRTGASVQFPGRKQALVTKAGIVFRILPQ